METLTQPNQIRLSSDTLINCMPKISYLIEKLQKKYFSPRWFLEDISFLIINEKVRQNLKFGFPMLCFCDMTNSDLKKDHLTKYGPFAISITKEWGITNGLNPVSYISNASFFITSFQKLLHSIFANQTCILDQVDLHLKQQLLKMVRYFKPYSAINAEMRVYYDEREWRFVPEIQNLFILPADRFSEDGRLKVEYQSLNNDLEFKSNTKLHFEYDNIIRMIVDSEQNKNVLLKAIDLLSIGNEQQKKLSEKILVIN